MNETELYYLLALQKVEGVGDIVAKKLEAVVSQAMVPIVCIGENIETRNNNQHQQFIAKQINNIFANLQNRQYTYNI